ncbi:MAG: alpha/beta hydrolase [Bacteroidota bacterium]
MKTIKTILVLCLAFCFQYQSYSLNPVREYAVTPDKFGMSYKEEQIKTQDGAVLNGWFFENAKKNPNWIVISGSGDGNMADNLEIVNAFLSAGYNVVTYDYRGYGKSSDFKIDPDLYIYPQFITDLNAVLDYLRKSRAITKFDLFGLNIGAGLTIGVGANRTETKKIIADGPWTSLEGMKTRIKSKTGKEPVMPFGFDKNHEPVYAFDKPKGGPKSLMIIVSSKDPLVGPTEIKTIKGATEVYVVKESGTNQENYSSNKDVYFQKVSKFLTGK